jgi:ssDNA thymidine ADP-ribosyltransferase, DarT
MPPVPTPILRFTHMDNLDTIIRRDGLHAPNHVPEDGLTYRFCHSAEVQSARADVPINLGPGGTIHDYVPFYFGYLSPMMLNLKTGRVEGYREGQEPLIYLVSSAQAIEEAGIKFVYSDGHGLATFTGWFDDLDKLDAVDWTVVNLRYWKDDIDDMDRQRKKQAEFLVHQYCPWSLIQEIVVIDSTMQQRVDSILADFPKEQRRVVRIDRDWYY